MDEAELGPSGWLLVGAVAVALLVVPATLLFVPAVQEWLAARGISQELYFALPLVPAVALAAAAVWAAVATRR